jgi:putative ABC transport system ATP-binding protein
MQEKTSLIDLREVGKTYKIGREKTTALDNINVSIYAGELLAIVGPSGSGKTTLTHIMGGLISPTHGDVYLQGKRLKGQSDKELSKYRNETVGFVFQNYSLIPYYTALENVMMPLTVAGIARRKRKEIALQYLKLVGLDQQANQRANQLSGGQRQRVGIARALTMKPQLIIADEPTGNLDTAHGNDIMVILKKLAHSKNIAVVMVTHNDHLARQSDRIIRIIDGKISGGTHARV